MLSEPPLVEVAVEDDPVVELAVGLSMTGDGRRGGAPQRPSVASGSPHSPFEYGKILSVSLMFTIRRIFRLCTSSKMNDMAS